MIITSIVFLVMIVIVTVIEVVIVVAFIILRDNNHCNCYHHAYTSSNRIVSSWNV